MASDRHQLMSSSDFPDPVVPATIACGPDRCKSVRNKPCCVIPKRQEDVGESHVRAMVRHGSMSSFKP